MTWKARRTLGSTRSDIAGAGQAEQVPERFGHVDPSVVGPPIVECFEEQPVISERDLERGVGTHSLQPAAQLVAVRFIAIERAGHDAGAA